MDLFPAHLTGLSSRTLDAFRTAGRRITADESCTGGLIAGVLTEIAGSSDVVGRTFVTYSNRAKQEVLGVPVATLEAHGAGSAQTDPSMADGGLHARVRHAQGAVGAGR